MSLTSSFLNLAIVLGLPHVIKQRFTQTSLLLGASAIQMGLWMATPSSIRTKSVKRTGSANKTTKITLKLADISEAILLVILASLLLYLLAVVFGAPLFLNMGMTIAWSIWAASMLVFPLLTVAGSVGEWNSAFSDSTFSASLPFHNVAIAGPVFLFGNWIACYLLPLDDRCSWMFWPSANAIVSSTMHTAAIVAVYFVFGVRQYFDISQNMCVVDLVPVSKNGSPSKVAPKKPASSPAKTTASLKKVVSSPVRKVSPAKTTTSPAKKSSPSKEPVVVIKAPETPTKRGRKSSPTEVKVAPPKKKDSLSKGSPFKNGALLSRSVSRIRKEGRSRSRSRSPRKTGALKK